MLWYKHIDQVWKVPDWSFKLYPYLLGLPLERSMAVEPVSVINRRVKKGLQFWNLLHFIYSLNHQKRNFFFHHWMSFWVPLGWNPKADSLGDFEYLKFCKITNESRNWDKPSFILHVQKEEIRNISVSNTCLAYVQRTIHEISKENMNNNYLISIVCR